MAALTKAVYDSALTDEDEPAEPSVARFLPGGTTVAALILVVVLIAAVGVWRHAATREHSQALAQSSSERAESGSAPVEAGPSPQGITPTMSSSTSPERSHPQECSPCQQTPA